MEHFRTLKRKPQWTRGPERSIEARKPKLMETGDLNGDKEAYLESTISLIIRSQNKSMCSNPVDCAIFGKVARRAMPSLIDVSHGL